MDYDTKQQPRNRKKSSVKRSQSDVGSEHLMSDTANYCNCLEKVQDYSKARNLVVTFVDIKNEDVPEVLYDDSGLEWQVWKKNYGQVLKYYWYNHHWYNHLLDKPIKVWDNAVTAPLGGFTRLYRGLPEESLPKPSMPKKAKSFLKKVSPKLKVVKDAIL